MNDLMNDLLTTAQAAEMIGISIAGVKKAISQGKIPAMKRGGTGSFITLTPKPTPKAAESRGGHLQRLLDQ